MPPCASCNQPVSKLLPCTWDTSLSGVGECCEFHLDDLIETLLEFVCESEAAIYETSRTVKEVVIGVAAHRRTCPKCSGLPQPKYPWVIEMPKRDELRRAA
jgi:hypothetical protein